MLWLPSPATDCSTLPLPGSDNFAVRDISQQDLAAVGAPTFAPLAQQPKAASGVHLQADCCRPETPVPSRVFPGVALFS